MKYGGTVAAPYTRLTVWHTNSGLQPCAKWEFGRAALTMKTGSLLPCETQVCPANLRASSPGRCPAAVCRSTGKLIAGFRSPCVMSHAEARRDRKSRCIKRGLRERSSIWSSRAWRADRPTAFFCDPGDAAAQRNLRASVSPRANPFGRTREMLADFPPDKPTAKCGRWNMGRELSATCISAPTASLLNDPAHPSNRFARFVGEARELLVADHAQTPKWAMRSGPFERLMSSNASATSRSRWRRCCQTAT